MHALSRLEGVVGYLSTFHGHLLIEFLCVAPAHRRTGIASALLGHVESRSAGRRVFISTEDWNTSMHRLLEARGYVASGSLTGLNEDGSAEVYYFKDVPA